MATVRKIRSTSVSRLLHHDAGHDPYEAKGSTGGFVVSDIPNTNPVLVAVRYRGIERDHRSREARAKGLRDELKRLRMSLTQVCGLHAVWGWDDQGEIDTTYLVASAAPIVPPYEADRGTKFSDENGTEHVTSVNEDLREAVPDPDKESVTPPEDPFRGRREPVEAAVVPVEPSFVHQVETLVGRPLGPVDGSPVADLFIRPEQIVQATKEIEFEHRNNQDGSAARMEHRLYHQTLTAIAAGAPEPQRLAALALETQHLYFGR